MAAEKALESVEGTPKYSIMLMNIANCDSVDVNIRVSATVTFKNLVKRNWRIVSCRDFKCNIGLKIFIKDIIIDMSIFH